MKPIACVNSGGTEIAQEGGVVPRKFKVFDGTPPVVLFVKRKNSRGL